MTRTKIPIDNRPPFRRRFRPTTLRRLSARPSRHIRVHTRHPVIQRVTPCRTHFARSLSGPSVREICNQMPNPSISAPPPRSYRLRRHFPRHCDVSTRAEHPYRPRFLPRDSLSTGSSPSGKRNFYSESQDLRVSGGRTLAPPRTCGCYQLAFVTPGISPFEAISRNWIRLMPNRRM